MYVECKFIITSLTLSTSVFSSSVPRRLVLIITKQCCLNINQIWKFQGTHNAQAELNKQLDYAVDGPIRKEDCTMRVVSAWE